MKIIYLNDILSLSTVPYLNLQLATIRDALTSFYKVTPKIQCLPPEEVTAFIINALLVNLSSILLEKLFLILGILKEQ